VAGDASALCRGEDGQPATAACLGRPGAIAVDLAGELYLADVGRIRHVDTASGTITTLAGSSDLLSSMYLSLDDLAVQAGRLVFPDDQVGQRVLGLQVDCTGAACAPPSSADTPSARPPACSLQTRRACLTDRDCDDGDPCNYDFCAVGACRSAGPFGVDGAACRAGQLAEATRCRGAGPSLVAKARRLRALLRRFVVAREGNLGRAQELLARFRTASARRARRGKLPARCAAIITRADEVAAILAEEHVCD
jgi:hypothetical protein